MAVNVVRGTRTMAVIHIKGSLKFLRRGNLLIEDMVTKARLLRRHHVCSSDYDEVAPRNDVLKSALQ